jgi:hypothetical protein
MDLEITPSELLHSYLDGELEQELELTLFSHLNSSPELRNEMRDMLALKNAVRSDKVAFTPPLAATAAVFGTLGMSVPATMSAVGGASWLSAVWSKIWIPLVSAGAGALVTVGAINGVSDSQSASSKDITATTSENVINAVPQELPMIAVPEYRQEQSASTHSHLSSMGSNSVQSAPEIRTKIVTKIKYVYLPSPSTQSSAQVSTQSSSSPVIQSASSTNYSSLKTRNNTEGSSESQASIISDELRRRASEGSASSDEKQSTSTLPIASTASLQKAQLRTSNFVVNQKASSEIQESGQEVLLGGTSPEVISAERVESTPIPVEIDKRFSIGIRGIASTSLVTIPTQAQSNALNNTALSLLYWASPNLGLGIEFGREPFAMNFTGVESGSRVRYQVHPSLMWGSAVMQLRMNSFSGFRPFVQLNAGFTEYGFLPRLTIGTQYYLTKSVSMSAGFESPWLMYNHQNQWFTTPKAGFTYGLMFKF